MATATPAGSGAVPGSSSPTRLRNDSPAQELRGGQLRRLRKEHRGTPLIARLQVLRCAPNLVGGGDLMDLDRTTTTVACACRRCGHRWLRDYDVVEWTDTEGAPVQWFSDHGISVPCPYQHGVCCPRCGGLRVDVAPARPGTVLSEAEISATEAAAAESSDVPARVGGPRLPFGPPFPAF